MCVCVCVCDVKVERSTGRERVAMAASHRGVELSSLASEALSLPADMASFTLSAAPVHLADHLQNFQHHQQLAGRVQELVGVVSDMQEMQECSRNEVAEVTSTTEKIKVHTHTHTHTHTHKHTRIISMI